MKWIIEDWAGNRIFPDMEFETYESGWEHIYSIAELEDEDFEDYYVVQLSGS